MIYIVLLFILFLIGIPICFSLGLVSVFGMVQGATPMIVVIQRLFTGADSTALIAIPLFILAGGLMVQGGISNRIVSFADALIGHFPSGLALVSILACMFFAAITGSAIAATAPVIEASDEEVAQSISVIFLFNMIAALLFPTLGTLLGFSTKSGEAFGIFAGTAINDTSSVTAAASTWDSMYHLQSATLDKAVTVKLTRTLAIIPITLVLSFFKLSLIHI